MLHVDGLEKSFGSRRVLKGVSFDVNPGETFGLIGGNGAGKSTIMNVIAGLLPGDAGWVTFKTNGHARNRLGIAMQDVAIYPSLTSEENLLFFGRLYGLTGRALRMRVGDVVEQTGLGEYVGVPARELSGGWQRRLNLAVALVHSPRLLLLDEPTAGLDVEARLLIWHLIRDLCDQGKGVLLTTHLLEEAQSLCDRLAILSGGRLVAQGTMEELRQLVPARELAVIECNDETSVGAAAQALGFGLRNYGNELTLLLPDRTTISALADLLGDIGMRSITLQPVGLLHIYLEVGGELTVPS